MGTWLQAKEMKIKIFKRRQKLGPNVSLNGNAIKPFDAAEAAEKDRRIGLPLKFNEVAPRQFRKTWKSGSGCNLSDAARAAMMHRQALRLEFLASIRNGDAGAA